MAATELTGGRGGKRESQQPVYGPSIALRESSSLRYSFLGLSAIVEAVRSPLKRKGRHVRVLVSVLHRAASHKEFPWLGTTLVGYIHGVGNGAYLGYEGVHCIIWTCRCYHPPVVTSLTE